MTASPANRNVALAQVLDLMKTYGLSLGEIADAMAVKSDIKDDEKKDVSNIIIKILSYLGALLVFAGIGIFTAIQWPEMSSLSRVIITLGPGLIAFILGIACMKDERYRKASTPLFIIAALMEPMGLMVYLKEYFEPTGNTELALSCVFALVSAQQILGFKLFKRTVLLFFSVLYGFMATALYLYWLNADEKIWILLLSFAALCVASGISKTSHHAIAPLFVVSSGIAFVTACFNTLDYPFNYTLMLEAAGLYITIILGLFKNLTVPRPVFLFLVLAPYFAFMATILETFHFSTKTVGFAIGLSGLLVAFNLRTTIHRGLAPLMFFICGFMLSTAIHAILLQTSFDVAMIGYGAGLMYLSVVANSRTLLFVSVCSLLGFLASFTNTYFADTLGWPIVLIGFGAILILISGYAFKLAQKMTATAKV